MKKVVLFVLVAMMFVSCNSPIEKKDNKQTELSKKELLQIINQGEKDLFGNGAEKINKKHALKLIKEYRQFANHFPNDSLAPEYLFKASDISMNLGMPQQTVVMFNRLISKYPDYSKIATCYFLRAFVYDDQLKDYKTAGKYYKEFLDKFPDSDFADDAQMLLQNMGKTPEELIKEFGE